MTQLEALLKAISVLGGPTKMAQKLSASSGEEVKPHYISTWKTREKRLPNNFALHVQLLTAEEGQVVYAHELSPNLVPQQYQSVLSEAS